LAEAIWFWADSSAEAFFWPVEVTLA